MSYWNGLRAQNIYDQEPVKVVGQTNGYSTSSQYASSFRRLSISAGTPLDGRGQWAQTYSCFSTNADFTPNFMTGGSGKGFLFISGPANNAFQNKWVFSGNGVAALDSLNDITAYNSGNDMGLNMTDSGYYTFVFNDVGYTANKAQFYVGRTNNMPVNLSQASYSINASNQGKVRIKTSASPSSNEKVYVRYTLNGSFVETNTSYILAASSVSGDTLYEATIPSYPAGSVISYYYFSSTMSLSALQAASEQGRSLGALRYDDNSGANYAYTLAKKFAVDFSVDPKNTCYGAIDSITVYAASPVFGNASTKLTLPATSNNPTATLFLDSGVLVTYKFRLHLNGKTIWEEDFSSTSGMREFVPHGDSTFPYLCWNQTSVCGTKLNPTSIYFVTYLGYAGADTTGKLYVMGNFNYPSWQEGAIRMTPLPGYNGYYYTLATAVCPETFDYKFVNGDSSLNNSPETFPDATQRNCTVSNGLGGYNRTHTRTGQFIEQINFIFDSCSAVPQWQISDSLICLGGKSTIIMHHSELWEGSNNLGQDSVFVSPSKTTTYQVKDFAGNQISQFTVQVIDSLNVKILSTAPELCGSMGSLNLNATPNNNWTYSWKNSGQTTGKTGDSIQINQSGWWTVKASNQNACFSYDSIQVDRMTLTMSSDTQIQCGSNAALRANVTSKNSVTYSWSPSAGLNFNTIANPLARPHTSQYYSVTATSGTCSLTDSVNVQVSTNLQLAFSANQTTDNTPPFDFVFTNSTPQRSNYQFTWHWGDGNVSANNAATVNKNYLFNGSYSVSLIAKDSNACIDTLSKVNYITTSGGADPSDIYIFNVSPQSFCGEKVVSFFFTIKDSFPANTLFHLWMSDIYGSNLYKLQLDSFQLNTNTGSIQVLVPAVSVGGAYLIHLDYDTLVSNMLALDLGPTVQLSNISGPSSINRLEKGSYKVTTSYGGPFSWTVNGGTIQSGQGSDSIVVEWTTLGNGSVDVHVNETCSDTQSISVAVLNVGIDGPGTNDLLIYPNPSNGTLHFESQISFNEIQIEVCAIDGKILFTKNINPTDTSISLDLLPGIYFIKWQRDANDQGITKLQIHSGTY